MKKMWTIGILVVGMSIVGGGAILWAQTTPAAFWVQANATPTYAAGLTYRLYTTPSGSPTNPAVTLTGVTCTGTSPTVACTAPLGPAAGAAALLAGAKSTLSAQDVAGGSAEVMSGPFTPDPSAPTSFKIK